MRVLPPEYARVARVQKLLKRGRPQVFKVLEFAPYDLSKKEADEKEQVEKEVLSSVEIFDWLYASYSRPFVNPVTGMPHVLIGTEPKRILSSVELGQAFRPCLIEHPWKKKTKILNPKGAKLVLETDVAALLKELWDSHASHLPPLMGNYVRQVNKFWEDAPEVKSVPEEKATPKK